MREKHRQAIDEVMGDDSDFVYSSLAEILSIKRPIGSPEEAFNSAAILADVLHLARNVMSSMELHKKDCDALAEILGALEVVATRIMEWEKKALGIGALEGTDIKFIKTPLNKE